MLHLIKPDLNTLYVDIKRVIIFKRKKVKSNLNTLYVDIKLARLQTLITPLMEFKYIIC